MFWPRIQTVPPRSDVGNKQTGPRYEIFIIGINLTSKKNSFRSALYKSYVCYKNEPANAV